MAPLRWGIMSAGKISHDFTACLKYHPKGEHEVVAVAARKKEDAQVFADRFNIPNVYGSYEEIVKDSNIDVVYIGTIHTTHPDCCKLALNAGKHVVCEKPMALNEKIARELINLAKEKNLFLLEGFWSRFFPAYETLRQELKDGVIGEVQQLRVSFGYNLKDVPRVKERHLGGGSLMDTGVYMVMISNLIFREKPEKIVANSCIRPTGVDMWTSVILYYSGNRVANLYTNSNCELSNEAFVSGTKGTMRMPLFWCPETLETPTGTHTVDLPKLAYNVNFGNSQGFVYEQIHVRECLEKGLKESPIMPHADTLEIMKILDEARRQIGVVYDEDK